MALRILSISLCLPLAGCLCLPEENKGEGVDTSYFSHCWDSFNKGPKDTIMFPKDAL